MRGSRAGHNVIAFAMTGSAAPFETTREAAYALGREAGRSGHPKLIHLPFNRFDEVDDTTWWLCPGPDNPAYKYGKIVCTWNNFEPEMFIGLTWLWHEFFEGLRSGHIGRVSDLMEEQCQQPVVVALDGGIVQGDWDFVRFDYTAGKLTCQRPGIGTLAPLMSARSLPEIAELIQHIPDLGWVWIDFHIGQTFPPDGQQVWGAHTIWTKVCSPLASWLR